MNQQDIDYESGYIAARNAVAFWIGSQDRKPTRPPARSKFTPNGNNSADFIEGYADGVAEHLDPKHWASQVACYY